MRFRVATFFVKIDNPQRQQWIGPSLTRRVTIVLTTVSDASRKMSVGDDFMSVGDDFDPFSQV